MGFHRRACLCGASAAGGPGPVSYTHLDQAGAGVRRGNVKFEHAQDDVLFLAAFVDQFHTLDSLGELVCQMCIRDSGRSVPVNMCSTMQSHGYSLLGAHAS